jgi:hypothetical protein
MDAGLNRYEQVRRIFDEALTRAPEARAAYLAEACAGDRELAREVAALLAAQAVAGSFLSMPAGVAPLKPPWLLARGSARTKSSA